MLRQQIQTASGTLCTQNEWFNEMRICFWAPVQLQAWAISRQKNFFWKCFFSWIHPDQNHVFRFGLLLHSCAFNKYCYESDRLRCWCSTCFQNMDLFASRFLVDWCNPFCIITMDAGSRTLVVLEFINSGGTCFAGYRNWPLAKCLSNGNYCTHSQKIRLECRTEIIRRSIRMGKLNCCIITVDHHSTAACCIQFECIGNRASACWCLHRRIPAWVSVRMEKYLVLGPLPGSSSGKIVRKPCGDQFSQCPLSKLPQLCCALPRFNPWKLSVNYYINPRP